MSSSSSSEEKDRCTYRPSVIYFIVNKRLSLSLSLSLSLIFSRTLPSSSMGPVLTVTVTLALP